MNTERFHYCDSNEDSFLDINEFEDYLFPHKSFKNVRKREKFENSDLWLLIFHLNAKKMERFWIFDKSLRSNKKTSLNLTETN